MSNVTRYLKHLNQSLAQTLYQKMKEEFGYDKIEHLPAEDLQRALRWLQAYQGVAKRVYDMTTGIESGFIKAVKAQTSHHDQPYADVLASLEAPLRHSLTCH